MELYIVGKINPENHLEWEFQGIFDSEKLANEACKNEQFFVSPVILNKSLPFKTTTFHDTYCRKPWRQAAFDKNFINSAESHSL